MCSQPPKLFLSSNYCNINIYIYFVSPICNLNIITITMFGDAKWRHWVQKSVVRGSTLSKTWSRDMANYEGHDVASSHLRTIPNPHKNLRWYHPLVHVIIWSSMLLWLYNDNIIVCLYNINSYTIYNKCCGHTYSMTYPLVHYSVPHNIDHHTLK